MTFSRFAVAMLIALAFAGCVDSEEPQPAEPEPCAADDLACLCDGDQHCIDSQTDTDGDGLTDAHEQALGTNVNGTDSDNDGVDDGAEVDAGTNPLIPHYPNDGTFEAEHITLTSEIGHEIPVTVFKPAVASAETPVPVLVHSHGFTGSRWTGSQAAPYVAAGFGVFSFDERGHGEARDDSTVTFMHPDAEVRDVIAVLDHIDSLDWVLRELDDPTDSVIGTMGGSYGGAFQLMTSIFDDRIDAMVPDITWHNIVEALAPNGAIKSGWVDLFYAAGNGFYAGSEVAGAFGDNYRADWESQAGKGVVFNNDFHAGFAWATGSNELPAGQGGVVPDLVTLFQEASPQFHTDGLDVPTLLMQGMSDTLFPLNQAVQNWERLTANGAPVALYTHLEGHIAPGIQGAGGGFPCGTVEDLTIQWHQQWLLDLPVGLEPSTCMSLEDGSTVTGDGWPLPGTEDVSYDVGGPWPMAQAVGGTTIPLYTLTAESDMTIAGIPRLTGTLTSPGPDTILYFSFKTMNTDGALEHIVNDQVQPLRIKGPNTGATAFDLDLGGIGIQLAEGDTMYFVVSSIEPMFFGNSERLPSGTVLEDLQLTLPVVSDAVSL